MHRRRTTPAPDARRRHSDALKDEVYRQMFRLEEGRAGADRELAIAVLCAWMNLDMGPKAASDRQWLRRICPICIGLLEQAPPSPGACGNSPGSE
jgi:hypothetical protein